MSKLTRRAAGYNTAADAGVQASEAAPTNKLRLTDRQLVLLCAAAQRDDHRIVLPETLRGKARDTLAQSLLRRGLAAEVNVDRGQSAWRREEATGLDLALVITHAGLAAIGVEDELSETTEHAGDVGPSESGNEPAAATVAALIDHAGPDTETMPSAASPGIAPRAGSKQAQLMTMLCAERGCTIDMASQALGWLPHTTRAALTGLRRKGFVIERVKIADGAGSRHRIIDPAAAASSEAA